MIKINKSPNVPVTLQNAPVPKNSSDVDRKIYRAADVRAQLMTDQGRKCAYCECRVRESYNDVEHYRPKNIYYWLGHKWDNLLYACEECNRTYKKAKFPLRDETKRDLANQNISQEEPLIVNPVVEDPSIHIKFKRYMAIPITDKGIYTVELFKLNNRPELVEDRKGIFEEYNNLCKGMKFLTETLASKNLPINIINNLNQCLCLTKKSLDLKTSADAPHSGMLISQIP